MSKHADNCKQRTADFVSLTIKLVETAADRYSRMRDDLMSVVDSPSGRTAWFEIKYVPRELTRLADFLKINPPSDTLSLAETVRSLGDTLRTWVLEHPEEEATNGQATGNVLRSILAAVETGNIDALRQEISEFG